MPKYWQGLIFLAIIVLIVATWQSYQFWPSSVDLRRGSDMTFHLNRIYALADALKNHQYPFYLDSTFVYGYGYASNWCYPNLFLFPLALMLNAGISLHSSYRVYLILCTLVTACLTYVCMYKVSRRIRLSIMISLLYSFAVYQILNVYVRVDLGEFLAFTFYPFIICGAYLILNGEKRYWYFLTIGLVGMVYCHVLSCVLSAILLLFIVLFSIKKIIADKKIIFYFLLAVCVAFLMSSFFLFPLLEQKYSNNLLGFESIKPYSLYLNSYSIGQLIKKCIFFKRDSPAYLGFVVFLPLLFRFFVKEKDTLVRFADKCLILGFLFLWMTTKLFPWKYILCLDVLQFPFRFFALVSLLFTFCGVVYIFAVLRKKRLQIVVSFLLLCLCAGNSSCLQKVTSDALKWKNHIFFIDGKVIIDPFFSLEGREYLPKNVVLWQLKNNGPFALVCFSKTTHANYLERNVYHLKIAYDAPTEDQLILPKIYYKGYRVLVNGEDYPFSVSNTGLIQVSLKGKGVLELYYEGTVIQKLSLALSVVALIGFVVYLYFDYRKRKRLLLTSSKNH